MPYIRTLRDAMTQETFFLENRTGRQFSRIVAALAWPHGIAQGCVIVLGEIRGRPAVLNVHNHVHVLNEYRSGGVADLVDMAVRLYEDWSASCVITPGDDRRVVFLDAANDDLRRERRRRIRLTDPQAWNGSGERMLPFYLGLLQQRIVGEKTLFFGPDCTAASEAQRLGSEDVDRRMTDYPGRGTSVGRGRDGFRTGGAGKRGNTLARRTGSGGTEMAEREMVVVYAPMILRSLAEIG